MIDGPLAAVRTPAISLSMMLRCLPGHWRRSRRCTAGFHEILSEPHPPAGQLIDARRRRTAQFTAAVRTQTAVTDVVGENEYDIGFAVLG